jgi:uncharacterized protein YndB with AHSA1/START domain
MTTNQRRQTHELFIRTNLAELWRSLTDGAVTRHYFFGTEVKSSFKKGDVIRYEMPDGMLTIDGTVLECEPERRLVHTWKIQYDPALTGESSTVEWRLEARGEACKLTVIHDFEHAPKSAAHLGEGKDGWNVVLSGLKTYLETGKPLVLPMAS